MTLSVNNGQSSSVALPPVVQPRGACDFICNQTKNLAVAAVAAHQLAHFTATKGGHLACAAVTIGVGLQSLYNGDLVTGAGLAAVGAREAFGLLTTTQKDVQRLLSDASAGMGMIQTLEAANKKSFESMESHLDVVSKKIVDAEQRLSDIKQLATHGSRKVQKQKELALKSFQNANELFEQAEFELLRSQNKISRSSAQFTQALSGLDQLVTLAQSTEGDFKERAAQFKDLAEKVHQECTEAKTVLDKGNEGLDRGIALLQQAQEQFSLAEFEAGKAMAIADSKFKKIAKRAKIESSAKTEVDSIKSEVSEVKERCQNISDIAKEAQENVDEAADLLGEKFGMASLILGGGGGALVGALIGPWSAAGGAILGAEAYHNRETIGNIIFGKDEEPVPAKPTNVNPVTFEFNSKSSGFFGRYISKRQSYTLGKVAIEIDANTTFNFDFDLNAKRKISLKDLQKLQNVLSEKLDAKEITPQHCLNVLTKLETLTIDRGDSHKKTTGFIKSNDAFFATLKRQATRLIDA